MWVNQIINSGAEKSLPIILRTFLYVPFMHTEDVANQKVRMCQAVDILLFSFPILRTVI